MFVFVHIVVCFSCFDLFNHYCSVPRAYDIVDIPDLPNLQEPGYDVVVDAKPKESDYDRVNEPLLPDTDAAVVPRTFHSILFCGVVLIVCV